MSGVRCAGSTLGLPNVALGNQLRVLRDRLAKRSQSVGRDTVRAGVFVRKPYAPPIDGFIRVTVGTAAERAALAEIFAAALDRVGDI